MAGVPGRRRRLYGCAARWGRSSAAAVGGEREEDAAGMEGVPSPSSGNGERCGIPSAPDRDDGRFGGEEGVGCWRQTREEVVGKHAGADNDLPPLPLLLWTFCFGSPVFAPGRLSSVHSRCSLSHDEWRAAKRPPKLVAHAWTTPHTRFLNKSFTQYVIS